jgi:hypothetical protein
MRRSALALIVALLPASALASGLSVPIDHAVRITLPAPAGDVVIGNPAIADVTVADDHHLLVIGKAMGATNLIVTASNGRPMMSREIVVSGPEINRISLITGTDTQTYACAPGCVKLDDQASGASFGAPSAAAAPAQSTAAPAPGNTSAAQPSPTTP